MSSDVTQVWSDVMPQVRPKLGTRALWLLFILGLTNGAMFCFPYMRYVFYDQQISAMRITDTQSGLMMSAYSLAMMISMIPGGILADKLPIKRSLVASIAGSFLIIVAYAFTMENFVVSLVLWFLVGLTTNFVFWCAITKAVGIVGTSEQQGTFYGLYYAFSGIMSAVINGLALWASGLSADPTVSLRLAMGVMAGATLLTLVLVIIAFRDKRGTEQTTSDDDVFKLRYVGMVLKNPMTWLLALLVMCAYGLYTSVSYFTPYLTDVLHIPPTDSSLISVVRSNLMNLLAPLGGLLVDRVFKSATKWYVTAFAITIAIYGAVMVMPASAGTVMATIMSLLPSAIAMMLYGVIWSGLRELRFNPIYVGTVIGIGSIIGYMPDLFYFVLFGHWLDTYGNGAYRMIFGFLMATAILGMVLAIVMKARVNRLSVADAV